VFAALKKYFCTVYQIWKQQYFNKKGSGLVVRLVKCSQIVRGLNPWKTFFFLHKNCSDPPKMVGLGLGQTV